MCFFGRGGVKIFFYLYELIKERGKIFCFVLKFIIKNVFFLRFVIVVDDVLESNVEIILCINFVNSIISL